MSPRRLRGDHQVVLYAFDLLKLDGEDLKALPLIARKAKLARLIKDNDGLIYSDHYEGDGAILFEHACRMGLEGIVSKKRDSIYLPECSRSWIKVRNPASPAMQRYDEGTW